MISRNSCIWEDWRIFREQLVTFIWLRWVSAAKKDSFATRPKNISSSLERFAEIRERLSNVIIENRDFEQLIKVYDSADTLFYLDPPYHKTERYYDNDKIFDEEDHKRLKTVLDNIKGRFVLSYNDDEFVRELYKDYNVQGITRSCTLSANSSGDKFREVIVKNYWFVGVWRRLYPTYFTENIAYWIIGYLLNKFKYWYNI